MKVQSLFTVLVAIGLVFALPGTAFAEVAPNTTFFPRTLRLGSYGDDVLLLQKILNSRPETRVSSFGIGSEGLESKYFGLKTAMAVKQFQEFYRDEILTPIGSLLGTGIVGPRTRVVLERLVLASITNQTPASTTTTPNITSPTTYKQPVLLSLSPQRGPNGTVVTLTGSNLPSINTIYTGYGAHSGIFSLDGQTMQFTVQSPIPNDMRKHVPELLVKVFILNAGVPSNTLDFVITND